jgi:hypothetical protein
LGVPIIAAQLFGFQAVAFVDLGRGYAFTSECVAVLEAGDGVTWSRCLWLRRTPVAPNGGT